MNMQVLPSARRECAAISDLGLIRKEGTLCQTHEPADESRAVFFINVPALKQMYWTRLSVGVRGISRGGFRSLPPYRPSRTTRMRTVGVV